MNEQRVQQLKKAIEHLNYAKYQVKLAMGDTDVGQDTTDQICELIAELDADIVFLKEGIVS